MSGSTVLRPLSVIRRPTLDGELAPSAIDAPRITTTRALAARAVHGVDDAAPGSG